MQTAFTREAYGEEIVKLGEENPDIVVLEADISSSTKTCYFAKRFPERFFNVGVAEQNEAIVAAGLASTGLVPFLSTYAVFATMRACEQVRTFICYPNLNVKIAVSHGGLTPCTDGVTHQATEDLAIMRVMPNMTVIWEAALAAAKFKLDNIIAIIDYNKLQLDGYNNEVMPIEPLAAKWTAFGWNVLQINGHEIDRIINAIETAKNTKGLPTVIIADTIKGKGVSYMEDKCSWHGKAPSKEEYDQAMKELTG